MKIQKRDGTLQNVSFNKIVYRLKKLCNDKDLGKLSKIDQDIIAQRVVSSLYEGMSSIEIDEEAARIAISLTDNREFAKLASRIIISNLHKNTIECFSEVMEMLNRDNEIIKPEILEIIKNNKDTIDFAIDYKRDYLFDYFGYKTLEKSYLMKSYDTTSKKMILVERPQHLYMRVALAVHLDDIPNVLKTYELLSQHYFTFASPTLFNGATKAGNLSSCFLLPSEIDSLEGIFKNITDTAKISKLGGGIGVSISDIRAKGSLIKGTNGISDGIVPMLKTYNSVSCYINQCFTPDTLVYSQNGPKQMRSITESDSLITIDGSFKRVNEIIKNTVNKEILEIISQHSLLPVKVTGEHELYLIKNPNNATNVILQEQLSKNIIKPDFYSASELLRGDLIGFPIPNCVYDNDNHDLEYYQVYGSNLTMKDEINIYYLHLPQHKIRHILIGLQNVYLDLNIFASPQKNKLIMQIKYLLLRLGILVSHSGQVKDYLYTNTNDNEYFEWNGILWGKITSIKKIYYSGPVYDFNMIDNHNYLTDLGLVHNSGKRKGSFAMYLSPWHADILDFLELRKNNGSEDMRARDLFYAMWISDEFMKAVESDADWYLMCPNECPGLTETFGDEFAELYWRYVAEGKFRRKIKAQEIWTKILESQIETGNPYITYKDAINKKSNQKNIGVIKSSNLCSEISLVSTSDRYSCCNLASIALPKYVEYNKGKPFINFEKLHDVAKYIILGMNRVIDNNVYPTPETELSNMENRPLGIGIQGENHLFIQMRVAFDSPEAKQINKEVFECIYHGCLEGSMELAKIDGSYSTFKNSPFSKGLFQFDLAKETDNIDLSDYLSDRYNWDLLREQVKEHGIRNSMLTACMPTASSAQILGNSESFDPIDSCIYKRRVLSGEYIIINKYLVDDLIELKLWNKEMKETIILNNGSIQSITSIPDHIRVLYKTCWELSMKSVIDLAADRQVFVDQMQSMNLFVKNPSFAKLTSMHFYGWKKHLKTGMYYLRSTTNSSAAKFSVNPELEQKLRETTVLEESESDCLACSS
jgi:ribonucleoside-diphosphate reductase alpha subunit